MIKVFFYLITAIILVSGCSPKRNNSNGNELDKVLQTAEEAKKTEVLTNDSLGQDDAPEALDYELIYGDWIVTKYGYYKAGDLKATRPLASSVSYSIGRDSIGEFIMTSKNKFAYTRKDNVLSLVRSDGSPHIKLYIFKTGKDEMLVKMRDTNSSSEAGDKVYLFVRK